AAGYGATVVLDGVSLHLGEGGAAVILGRNGVGKSTLLLTIMGHTALHRGRLRFAGAELGRLPAHRRARLGPRPLPPQRPVSPPGPPPPQPRWCPFPRPPGRAPASRRLPPASPSDGTITAGSSQAASSRC